MYGIRILMNPSRPLDDEKIEKDKKWTKGDAIIRYNLGYNVFNVEEYIELDAIIGVQNYMQQEFFGAKFPSLRTTKSYLIIKNVELS